MTMLAFHSTLITKDAVLAQLRAHAQADELVKGRYWRDGKGCAIGCTIHSGIHAEYEPRFGVPQMLARLEDCIFEGLPNDQAKVWPERFMSAVTPGADLSCIGWKFLHWLLTDEQVNPGIDHPIVRDTIKRCADLLLPFTKGIPADACAESAASAAWSAAYAASAENAESAARSAESAESAARSAAWSAASAARSAAWSAAYERMADRLIELIEAAPVVVAEEAE